MIRTVRTLSLLAWAAVAAAWLATAWTGEIAWVVAAVVAAVVAGVLRVLANQLDREQVHP